MKVLLLGHRGYLGSYLNQHLDVDVLETRDLYDNGIKYDYVVNCIGIAVLEYCEEHKEESDYANRDVILDIQKYYPKAKIINFSSYYVYNQIGLCTEDSLATIQYNYCRQKLEAEELITNGVSFRIGKLFGHPDLNKQNKLTEYILKTNDLILDEVYFNPTSLRQVLKAVEYELERGKLNGVYNLANAGITNHYKYGQFIDIALNSNKNITKINKHSRSFNNYGYFSMDCSKINRYIKLTHWSRDLLDYLDDVNT
jgi:dTDP-4-dehydrorhamnose reductase